LTRKLKALEFGGTCEAQLEKYIEVCSKKSEPLQLRIVSHAS
jgi:hypothetical protein